MKKIVLLLSVILFPALAPAEDAQIYIEFKLVSKDIRPDSFDGSVRKLWRVGKRYARLEEAPDRAAGIHGLLIVNAPNSYLINLYTKTGKHVVDPGPSIDVHVPVFQSEQSKDLLKLEMGHEMEFFRERKATRVKDDRIDGIRCTVYQVSVENSLLKLFVSNETKQPCQVSIMTADRQYAVRYLKYSTGGKFDEKLYAVPDSIKLVKVN